MARGAASARKNSGAAVTTHQLKSQEQEQIDEYWSAVHVPYDVLRLPPTNAMLAARATACVLCWRAMQHIAHICLLHYEAADRLTNSGAQ